MWFTGLPFTDAARRCVLIPPVQRVQLTKPGAELAPLDRIQSPATVFHQKTSDAKRISAASRT